MKRFAALLISIPTIVFAQEPTVVFGASQSAPGVYDEYTVSQPENSPNPLGDPIVAPQPVEQQSSSQPSDANTDTPTTSTPEDQPNVVKQSSPQDPAPFSVSPQQEQNQIENTLYQGGNRIYDIQSYPLQDIKTITEPNINPTITTYPEY